MITAIARSYTNLGRAILRFPTAPWEDALSHGQMQSKAWAIQTLGNLHRDLGLVYIVGGWLGTMGLLMLMTPQLQVRKIRSFDIDPSCASIADYVNSDSTIDGWRFKAVTMDMLAINYAKHHYVIPVPGRPDAEISESCNTIVNTCCEHLDDFARWWALIPPGKLIVLQNTNLKHITHVNTVRSLDHLRNQAPMTTLLSQQKLRLANYTRFMLIGIK